MMLVVMEQINELLGKYDVIIASVIGIIGIVTGIVGGINIHNAMKIKVTISKLESKIEQIEVKNSQLAQTINNYGLSYRDTKDIVEEVTDQKTKNKPDVYYSKEEPVNAPEGSIWIQKYD